MKLQLAKDGVCETIYRLLETYKTLANTNEARALMKLACDLIVLILTGGKTLHQSHFTGIDKQKPNIFHSSLNLHFICR